MNLRIHDPAPAPRRNASRSQTLAERASAIAQELAALAQPGGHQMTQAEVDWMWGHTANAKDAI